MNKIVLAIVIIILVGVIGVLGYVWYRANQTQTQKQEQATQNEAVDEAAAQNTVEGFGQVLKNVSLLSPTASQDIQQNYHNFVAPELLAQWESDPSKALGRLTSSPWPDRIEISSIQKINANSYRVTGQIIEITSQEEASGGVAATQGVELVVGRMNGKWLISSAALTQ